MIRERLIAVWEYKGLTAKKLEAETGIDREKWYALRNGRRRANEEDIEAFVKIAPEYAFWIASGLVIPESGQTSPEFDEANRNLNSPNAG